VRGVAWIQRKLNALGANPPLVEDGIFGDMTTGAMVAQMLKDHPND
jgi:peptidoglycan hydrolase-like protein with peptidoglycan-binding domain